MAENVQLVDPNRIEANKENPRLIFREDELLALEGSIHEQGILVPLTVFADGRRLVLLDGERRWRCARKLNLPKVPVIIQPKPQRLQNIMMMFAIHKARSDWDPLPTARKLKELEDELAARHKAPPTLAALAAAASLPRGEVMRYRRILNLPDKYQTELMSELEKPRSEQVLTVDHVLEAVRGAESLMKNGIIDNKESRHLAEAIVEKFRKKTEKSTVAPRLLPKISRAVERGEITKQSVRRIVEKLTRDRNYTIQDAYRQSAARADLEHDIEQISRRLTKKLNDLYGDGPEIDEALQEALRELHAMLGKLI